MLSKAQVETLKRCRTWDRNRIAKAMDLAGVTQVQLAQKTGFTQSYISRVKNGLYSDLPGETMRTFADCFGCQMDDLFPAREQAVSA